MNQLSMVGGLRDCKAVIRIFNQDFQDSSCYGEWRWRVGCRGERFAAAYSSISPVFPSSISKVVAGAMANLVCLTDPKNETLKDLLSGADAY